jgi:hypothetical protein
MFTMKSVGFDGEFASLPVAAEAALHLLIPAAHDILIELCISDAFANDSKHFQQEVMGHAMSLTAYPTESAGVTFINDQADHAAIVFPAQRFLDRPNWSRLHTLCHEIAHVKIGVDRFVATGSSKPKFVLPTDVIALSAAEEFRADQIGKQYADHLAKAFDFQDVPSQKLDGIFESEIVNDYRQLKVLLNVHYNFLANGSYTASQISDQVFRECRRFVNTLGYLFGSRLRSSVELEVFRTWLPKSKQCWIPLFEQLQTEPAHPQGQGFVDYENRLRRSGRSLRFLWEQHGICLRGDTDGFAAYTIPPRKAIYFPKPQASASTALRATVKDRQ